MKRGIIAIAALTILVFALGITLGAAGAERREDLELPEIARKLEEILSNQAEILKELEQMKQELAVIKVRASRR